MSPMTLAPRSDVVAVVAAVVDYSSSLQRNNRDIKNKLL